ncbi:cytochrome P450 [Allokutzneria sp. NRRL B-24872]|uniref:cytochrome P450 n=1 Tax=Allokutzneria sp. NRRL B-24872 TaxID=1137961 RepID=UPI001AEFB8BF|nr:cytochrome P450 [Allokutzneria sp. NRRL B-24872]
MTDSPLPVMTEAPVHIRRDAFDPAPELAALREREPVTKIRTMWGSDAWLVTRYELIREALGDASRFANNPRHAADLPPFARQEASGMLLNYDPPEHTSLRRLLTPEFTVRRIRRLQPRIEAIVEEHLDAMEQAGPPVDLVQAFALPIPSLVICELLGVPYEDREDFQRLSNLRLDMSVAMEVRLSATQESLAYMAKLVQSQRAAPGEDMIGMLIREHADKVTDAELVGVADLLLLAGHETTSNMLGLGTLKLLQHPDQRALAESDEHVEAAVEELLRYMSITHTIAPRWAIDDTELGGQRIGKGELVIFSIPAGNRDPAMGENLEALDIGRKTAPHLAFGHGVHHCLGAPLARMEMRVAYPALLRRFPKLRPALPVDEVEFRAFSVVYGLASLPVTW